MLQVDTELKLLDNSMKMNLPEANYTFTPEVLTFYYGVTALFSCNVLVGLPANVYVVWLIGSGAGGAVASELFALNLAIFEIVFCLLSLYLLPHFLLRMSMDLGIQMLRFAIGFMFISRPTFQSNICLERYLAVVHPVVFIRFRRLRYRLACCVVDWLLILLYCIVPIFTLSTIRSTYLLICMSMFFLVVMLYCSVRILRVLRQSRPGDGDRESWNSMKRKAFKVIMITLVFTGATQFLQVFILGSTLLYAPRQVLQLVILVSLSISIIGGFVTPLLYIHRAGKLPCIKF